MDDFRKFATKHLGMNSMVLDDVIKSQGYLNPYILEDHCDRSQSCHLTMRPYRPCGSQRHPCGGKQNGNIQLERM